VSGRHSRGGYVLVMQCDWQIMQVHSADRAGSLTCRGRVIWTNKTSNLLELVSNREADEQVLTRKKKLDKRAFPPCSGAPFGLQRWL
jgi:hypothetical protein